MEEGKKLTINYKFISQFQTIAGQQKFSIGITRSLTRLKSVFVTFRKDYTVGYRANAVGSKSWNDFVSPMWPDVRNHIVNYNQNGEFEFWMQIGSKMFSEYPIRSHAEAYSQLRKTLGIHSPFKTFDIRGAAYRRNKMILAIDCERILDLPFTGLNTRAGDQTVIKILIRFIGHIGE